MGGERPPAAGAWRTAGASVRGAAHARRGQPCQDAHHYRELPGGVLVAAVADGAGSAALAEVGARIASAAAVGALADHAASGDLPRSEEAWQDALLHALAVARAAVEAEAETRGAPLRDVASTLLLAVLTPALAAAMQVGDGAVVLGEADGTILGLTTPRHGEYLNETTFLVSADYLSAAQVVVRPGRFENAALFSDGLQGVALKMPEGTPHVPFFAPLFRFFRERPATEKEAREQLAAFLSSPRIEERTDDDRTLLLATRA